MVIMSKHWIQVIKVDLTDMSCLLEPVLYCVLQVRSGGAQGGAGP